MEELWAWQSSNVFSDSIGGAERLASDQVLLHGEEESDNDVC